MKMAAKIILLPLLFILTSKANAKVEWNEPEVVPEKLVRKNRRVLRFSGVTAPGAQLRIRKGRLKLYLDNGKTRWAKIPQKNRVQFPVVSDRDGAFTFDLYLPTVAVEIPVEVRNKKRWVPYTLNFRVPDAGSANDFQAMEESFEAQEDSLGNIERDDNYYSRKNDQGMQIQDRGGKQAYSKSKIQAWGGLGLAYFNTAVDVPWGIQPAGSNSGSTLVIPSFRLGLDWDYTNKWRIKGAIRSASGSTDDIGNINTQGKDFSWLEAQVGAIYFSDMVAFTKKGRMGLDFGFQLQGMPYFRFRTQNNVFLNQTTYIDTNTYNLHIGLHYEKNGNKTWDYEMYGRYLYTISSGDGFNVESFPLNFQFGGGIKKPLTRGLALGIFAQLDYFSFDTSYSAGASTINSDLTLMLFTVDARLIANF